MYYTDAPSTSILEYHGVEIFEVYKNDNFNSGPRSYSFGTDPMVSDDSHEGETAPFDIRDEIYESIPEGKRHLETPYRYDPHKTVEENLKHLIDLGGIDLSNGREVLYEGYGKISTGPYDKYRHYEYSFKTPDGRQETFTSIHDMLHALGYYGIKLWDRDDIISVLEDRADDWLGRDMTVTEQKRLEKMADETAKTFARNDLDSLTDCTESDWEALEAAVLREVGKDWLEKITKPEKARKKGQSR